MKNASAHDIKIAKISFAKVYPLYVTKVERKGRSKQELDQVIFWLTGFDASTLTTLQNTDVTFEEFFAKVTLPPEAHKISGTICGVRIENIENPLTQKIRYLDKLVDELAKGKKMEKILRT